MKEPLMMMMRTAGLSPAFLLATLLAFLPLGNAALAQVPATSEHGKTKPAAPAQPVEQPAAPAAPAAPAQAQPEPAANAAKPASPVGAGASWEANTQTATAAEEKILEDQETLAIINSINNYFNTMTTMQGLFLQTDADNKQKKGKFYFERPGKIRFDYNLPSKQKIISDGKYLAIEDHDLKTSDRYPLETTPFRMLLAEQVDFLRDARILSLDQGPDVIILAVEDKSADAAGQIRLFFSKPELQLKEWIITDPQGLNTRIEITELELNKTVSADLFKFSDIALPSFR